MIFVDKKSYANIPEAMQEASKSDEKARHLKVLIAEDDALNKMYLAGVIKGQGWDVELAANGYIAIEKYANETFDIILMDGQMPKMDGFEATRKIREIEVGTRKHTPIIAITGYATPGDRDKFIQAGMDEYITKPLNEGKLIEIILQLTKIEAKEP
ncbi:MAG TPA: hypothetical protein DCM62_02405 [Bacteroidales bacterium]|nr:hypothetical protein [Bacteroidales bacterium]